MKNYKNLLPLSLGLLLLLGGSNAVFAAESASQTVTATLQSFREVSVNGGTILSSIDSTGALTAPFDPGFIISTNNTTTQNLTLTATVETAQGAINAFSGDATTQYITLGLSGTATPPTQAAVMNAQSASPSGALNADVITYPITKPQNLTGLTYSWNTQGYFDAELTGQGEIETELVVPAGAAKAGTFSGADNAGDYKATVTLSFT